MPSNNGRRVPPTQVAHTTRNETWHRKRYQATPHQGTTNLSQEWQAASRGCTLYHTPKYSQSRSGGAQPKPEPKHTHPYRTPQPGVGGYERSVHKTTQTYQQPSHDWWGSAKTRAEAHTHKAHPLVAGYQRTANTYTHTPQHPSHESHGAAEQ